MERPLILVTNDDGITSLGLWRSVEALLPLGEILVVAPDRQWSGAGRAMPQHVTGRLTPASRDVKGQRVKAYAVDATPALAVDHGVLELASRRPSLVVSGINSGANLSYDITISGTVGAAFEAAAFGIPALAVSLEMDAAYHLAGNMQASYIASQILIHAFADQLLRCGLPEGVDLLNLNVPSDAREDVVWRWTRLARQRYFTPEAPDRTADRGRPRYRMIDNPLDTSPDSDVWAVLVDRVASATAVSLDMTARVDFSTLDRMLSGALPDRQLVRETSLFAPECAALLSAS
ncbi:MAG: 5'/3'-nucleotidase SurE [Anaerolineae bacterium]|nr:5'/3'-nucleotidase SurE [Anaerolineae bacterium]